MKCITTVAIILLNSCSNSSSPTTTVYAPQPSSRPPECEWACYSRYWVVIHFSSRERRRALSRNRPADIVRQEYAYNERQHFCSFQHYLCPRDTGRDGGYVLN
jgi:hypothetical protein